MTTTSQFEISKAVRIFGSSGKKYSKKDCSGTIFYDPPSTIWKYYFQTSLNYVNNIILKNNFEHFMVEHGVSTNNYLTDSRIFAETKFMQEIAS